MLSRLKKQRLNTSVEILHYVAIGLMIILFAYSLSMWLYTSSIWGFGGIFWSSWMAFALVYLGTAVFLRISGVSAAESFIISLTSAINGLALRNSLSFLILGCLELRKAPYFLLNGNAIFLNYGIISLTALSGYKYLKANKWFWLAVIAMTTIWLFWITGFSTVRISTNDLHLCLPKNNHRQPICFSVPASFNNEAPSGHCICSSLFAK